MGILIQNFSICVLLFTGNIISQYVNRRPWPTYSLHNMPQTSFTCQDKILGGYYADPETQCQMFHVCVKVAGVGVQDFRFLCPNGTAFDQEAQICADWGDVDCEQATLYYSSDNFDLYRLGSGFESKRAPLAEEEESTFHLQRAETNNIRRSKQTVVDQRSRPENNGEYKEKINNYNTRKSFVEPSFQIRKSTSYPNTFDENRKTTSQQISTTKTPSYIKSTIPAQITTKSYNYPQEEEILKGSHSSNFFNNRYNGKEEDLVDFNTEPPRSKPQTSLRTRQRGRNTQRRNQYNNNNILTSPSKVVTAITTETSRITPEQKSFTSDTKHKSQTLTLQTSFRTADLNQYKNQEQVKTVPDITSTTQANFPYNLTPTKPQPQQNIQPTTYNPSNNGFKLKSTTSRYENFGETGKPINSQKSETNQNPFYNNQFEYKANEYNFENFNQPFNKKNNTEKTALDINSSTPANSNNNLRSYSNGNDFSSNKEFQKLPTRGNERRRIDLYEKTLNTDKKQQNGERIRQEGKVNKAEEVRKPNAFGQTQKFVDNSNLSVRPLDPQKLNSAFHNQSDVNENQDRYYSNSFNRRITLTPDDSNYQKLSSESKNNKKYEQLPVRGVPSPFTNSPSQYSSRNTSPSPPFNDYIRQTSSLPLNQNTQQDVIPSELSTPRGFSRSTQFATKTTISNLPTTTRKSQTNDYDKYQTVNRLNENYTPSSATKKFSTLVPKDQYYPTTFKPTTYKKQIDIFNTKVDKIQTKPSIVSYLPTTTTTSTTTQRSVVEPDEDDGQYHPELYEKQLPRSQFNVKPTKVQIPINQHSDFSDEDEFLKTAHSLNIAAGANQLRAEKAKQSSPNSLYKSSSLAPSKKPSTPSLPSKTSLKPKKPLANEDTSYDYAYYDTNGGNSHDYAEYDVISEFGKTKKQ